jgi:two-component system sensor histidine kinase KdpD
MITFWKQRLLRVLASVPIVALVAAATYYGHAKSFAAGFIFLFPVMFIAFRWGILEATVASVLSVGCLDYFFTNPLFHLYMSDPQDWVALSCFEAIVLIVSRFANHLKEHVVEADHRSEQVEKLYQMSRNVLLLDRKDAVGSQIVKLIQEVFHLDGVSLWDARGLHLDSAGAESILGDDVRAASLHEDNRNDTGGGRFLRQMVVGSRSIGVIGLACGPGAISIDASTADAIASLAALALERAYSFKAESDAEASKQMEQFRSAVLDGLAHSFKTPLATIQAASSGLLEISSLESTQEELVTLINQEAIRLGFLTTEALQAADMDEECLKINKEETSVGTFLKEVAEQSQDRLLDHPLSVANEIDEKVMWADRRLLRMALLELLDNASKYADSGAPITLYASLTDVEVIFGVRNAGSYIEPEERMRIFRRFYRSPGSRHRASGTGIGLSFVRRIVEAHHGRVWVKSEPDAGTTVFLSLPHSHKEI